MGFGPKYVAHIPPIAVWYSYRTAEIRFVMGSGRVWCI